MSFARGNGRRWRSRMRVVGMKPFLWVRCLIICEAPFNCAPSDRAALRACLEIARGAAARDFGFGQGGEEGASPQRAVPTEPTPDKDKRPAGRRVFGRKAVWLRCSSVEDPQGVFSFVAPRHPAFSPKTAPLGILRQALRRNRIGCVGGRRRHW